MNFLFGLLVLATLILKIIYILKKRHKHKMNLFVG